jgi:hypothetical protein
MAVALVLLYAAWLQFQIGGERATTTVSNVGQLAAATVAAVSCARQALSWVDAGFLMFPLLAPAGLLVRPSVVFRGRGRLRSVLAGAMVAASLFTLSWVTSLGQTIRVGAATDFAFFMSLAYPIGDLVLITVALMVLAHTRVRTVLVVLIAGLVAMAVADSSFLYPTATESYATGAYVDVAWVAAFVLIAMSARGHKESGAAAPAGWLALGT